jgi:fructose-1-phosphate kinase PfkB-like protein
MVILSGVCYTWGMGNVVTVTANPLLDHLAEATWRTGAVARTSAIARIAGGKGINVARVLARHGHSCTAVCLGGGHEADDLAHLIEVDGISPLLVRTAARLRIGFQLAGPQEGTVACCEDGFGVTAEERERFVAAAAAALRGAELCIISGSVPAPGMDDVYRRIADAAAAAGVPCWIDSYGKAMFAALAGAHPPALAKPNRQEYGDDPQPWLAARELHVTDGGSQVTVRAPEGRYRVVPPTVSEINPIGSGDCWLAGYAHGRLSGWDVPRSLAWAAAAGAANAGRSEVARVGPEDIRPLLSRVDVVAVS